MKAIYFERYGGPDVLRYGERPTPRPRPGQVLIQVHAAGINPRDWMLREGRYFARHLTGRPPIIPGSDVSGVIALVGSRVTDFAVGDEVFAMQTHLGRMGGYAEYTAVNASAVAHKPPTISHIDAAAVPVAGLTAWQSLFTIGHINDSSRVLVVGASGGVGHYAVQLAASHGAKVTGVCSTSNVELVRELGASDVIDYKTEHFADVARDHDLVFDTLGRESLTTSRAALTDNGRYVTTIPAVGTVADAIRTGLVSRVRGGPRSSVVFVSSNAPHLAEIADLMAKGQVRSLVDTVYPLTEAADAHRQSRTFRTRGKLVLHVRD
jgi:NADPH:quinone reductase-like Zn-dependent oxidoreductase